MRFLNPAEVARLADVIGARCRALVLAGAYGACGSGSWSGCAAAGSTCCGARWTGRASGPVGDADAHVFTADKGRVLRPSNFRVKVWLPPARPVAAQRGPRRSKQPRRPGGIPGLGWDDGSAPPGTRTPDRCLKRDGRRDEA
jgi:hypothetical protein